MPSRSNPNTPTSQKPKTARTLKSKRKNTQRLNRNKITKPTPRTSQALRRAAPLSNKKARKIEKRVGYSRKRAMEEVGEVEMRDIEGTEKDKRTETPSKGTEAEAKMEVDEA
ncbi:hypothetical protein P7C71_g3946, partial [Lecanoromycetidae sp. Uapishka_2]